MNTLLHGLDALCTSSTAKRLAGAWRGMSNLILPNPCVLCTWSDAVEHQLCLRCEALLKNQHRQIIQAQDYADGLPINLVTGQALPVFASSFYTEQMAKVLLQFKDHQCIRVAGFLRPIMYRTLQYAADYLQQPYYRLMPIPASSSSMRKRGFNPVTVMLPKPLPATLIYDAKTLKIRWRMLHHASHRGTGGQTRRAASKGKFRLATNHDPPAEPVIIVDDVLTTGATIAAAARTLQTAGFDVVAAVVISAVMPRS